MKRVDVVVIGAGPAGSTAACLLARTGVSVVVLEREAFPRFHIGESLLPASAPVWSRLGVTSLLEARYLRKNGVRFVDCRTERVQEFAYRDPNASRGAWAFQVPRADFDDQLVKNAVAAGADVRMQSTVREVLFDGDTAVGVRATDSGGTPRDLASRVVIDASGRDTLLASRVRAKTRIPGLDKTALFGHFVGVEREAGLREGHTEVVIFPHGWFWHVPFRGEVSSVGMVCSSNWIRARRASESLEAFFERTLADAPWMQRRMRRSRRLGPMRALGDYSYRVDRLAGNGWLMVGDAAGFVDPVFCSGTFMAFRSAEAAADLVSHALSLRADVSDATAAAYEAHVRPPADVFLGAVQAFYDGTLAEHVFDRANEPAARSMLTALVTGDVCDVESPVVRALREACPPRLPDADSPPAPPGASGPLE